MDAPPHVEQEYYHEDAMSQLGIKFSQHELMHMETAIQVIALLLFVKQPFVCSLLWHRP